MKCYYAHTMISYDSTIEKQDLELLEKLGFEVINPNTEKIKKGCSEYIKMFGKEKVMDYFYDIVCQCDIVAFRSIPTGQILSGISRELEAALENNIPIIELPCNLKNRMQEYPETKNYLIELGFYKC